MGVKMDNTFPSEGGQASKAIFNGTQRLEDTKISRHKEWFMYKPEAR